MQLNHLSCISSQDRLFPIGRYVFKSRALPTEFVTEQTLLQERIGALDGRYLSAKNPTYTLDDLVVEKSSFFNSKPLIKLDLTPQIDNFSIIWTEQQTTITFVGKHLDSSIARAVYATTETLVVDQLPFRLVSSTCHIDLTVRSRIEFLDARSHKMMLGINACSLSTSEGDIQVINDFGMSNVFHFTSSHVTRGTPSSPNRALHPTMNPEFLSAAYLRVAIFCHRYGKGILAENIPLKSLWDLLVDLENCTLPNTPINEQLPSTLDQYLEGQTDIGTMRNMSYARFEKIAEKIVSDFKLI
jgi:hypothetical protein